MEQTLALFKSKDVIKQSIFDFLAILFVYFIPTFSHMVGLPLYYLDPMRLIVILSIVHTKRQNSYVLALTLPLFSFFISSHPVFAKAGLIMAELSVNIFLFYFLSKKINNVWLPIFLSILISKVIYYFAKYLLLQTTLLSGELLSTPIWIQSIALLIFTGYLFAFYRENK